MTIRTYVVVALLLACAGAWPGGARAQGAAAPATADSVRQAVQSDRRGLVEKYMKLSGDEAKRFWPIYEDHQRRLDRIVQRQNRAVLDYINTEDSMTNANAKRIVKELLEADGDEQRLRERTAKAVMAVLPAKKAARYLQIENKIRALNRFDLAERLPLVR